MLERLAWLFRQPNSVIQEWEWYARNHQRTRSGAHLGDEWNDPVVVGLEAPGEGVVACIDRMLIAPFIGEAETILEIGSGGGRFTDALARRAKRLIATDTSPTMVSLLRKRFEGRPSIEIRRVDGFRLGGLADQSIDAAFSYDVFIHLTHWHVYSYLEELHRVLRPGGRAIVHHANSFSPLGWQRFLRDLSRAREHQPAQAQFCPMTPELMRGLAERAGLTVEDSNTTVVRRDCITLLSRPA